MKKDWCKHYNGLSNKVCSAGVDYHILVGKSRQILRCLPCFAENTSEVIPCQKREWPTDEELVEQQKEISRRLNDMVSVRQAIVKQLTDEDNLHHNVGGGQIDCPACGKGIVNYTYAGAYNGHIHARCTTNGCVNWME